MVLGNVVTQKSSFHEIYNVQFHHYSAITEHMYTGARRWLDGYGTVAPSH